MNKQRGKLEITRPILVFSMVLLALLVLMSCFKKADVKTSGNLVQENSINDKKTQKNTYYGKYNLKGEDILGNFQINKDYILFVSEDGLTKDIIEFSKITSIYPFEHPDGKVDVTIDYSGENKIIKNVNYEMVSYLLANVHMG